MRRPQQRLSWLRNDEPSLIVPIFKPYWCVPARAPFFFPMAGVQDQTRFAYECLADDAPEEELPAETPIPAKAADEFPKEQWKVAILEILDSCRHLPSVSVRFIGCLVHPE